MTERKTNKTDQLELDKKIAKLPKWAIEHFKTITMQRDAAVRALDNFENSNTESAFFFEDAVCDGVNRGPTNRRNYSQGYKIQFEHAGVGVSMLLRDDSIEIAWDGIGRHGDDIVMQPKSWQMISLFQFGAKRQR